MASASSATQPAPRALIASDGGPGRGLPYRRGQRRAHLGSPPGTGSAAHRAGHGRGQLGGAAGEVLIISANGAGGEVAARVPVGQRRGRPPRANGSGRPGPPGATRITPPQPLLSLTGGPADPGHAPCSALGQVTPRRGWCVQEAPAPISQPSGRRRPGDAASSQPLVGLQMAGASATVAGSRARISPSAVNSVIWVSSVIALSAPYRARGPVTPAGRSGRRISSADVISDPSAAATATGPARTQ